MLPQKPSLWPLPPPPPPLVRLSQRKLGVGISFYLNHNSKSQSVLQYVRFATFARCAAAFSIFSLKRQICSLMGHFFGRILCLSFSRSNANGCPRDGTKTAIRARDLLFYRPRVQFKPEIQKLPRTNRVETYSLLFKITVKCKSINILL